jgi:spore maturation protein CgeB
VEYRDAKDLTDKIKYYLKNEVERKNIAEAGQKRTLTDHNYKVLMVELTKIISKYLYGSK